MSTMHEADPCFAAIAKDGISGKVYSRDRHNVRLSICRDSLGRIMGRLWDVRYHPSELAMYLTEDAWRRYDAGEEFSLSSSS